MLFAAGLCALFLAAAVGFEKYTQHTNLFHTLYALSYLAGAWFAAGEASAHIKQGKIDIHFLMLLVAEGGAT